MCVVVVVDCQSHLLQIVPTLRAAGGLHAPVAPLAVAMQLGSQ